MNNNIYIFIESIRNTYEAGGVVMLPILITGVVGFYYLYSSWFRIGGDSFRKNIWKSVDIMRRIFNKANDAEKKDAIKESQKQLKKRRGIVAREMCYALQIAYENHEQFNDYMQVRMIKTIQYLERGTHVISVMAATAPLLGLLGTVTGMVSTFEVITLYGNQNPVLMADGISEALISTQSGLLVAFPLTLLNQRLNERVELLTQQLKLGATIIENFISSKDEE